MKLVTYNVKDLFDAGARPSPDHPNFTVSGEQFEAKLEDISRRLRAISPDVVLLQEVTSARGLESLARRIYDGSAHSVLADADDRGIRCAAISRFPFESHSTVCEAPIRFPSLSSDPGSPFGNELRAKRAFLHAVLAHPSGPMHVIAVHLKSNRPFFPKRPNGDSQPRTPSERAEGDLRSTILRAAEALSVRKFVDTLFVDRPDANVLVGGDFNDHAESITVRIVQGGDPHDGLSGTLYPTADRLPRERRFSVLHRGSPKLIDHILVSAALASRIERVHIHNEDLRDHDTLSGDRLPPDSDHAAVEVVFSDGSQAV